MNEGTRSTTLTGTGFIIREIQTPSRVEGVRNLLKKKRGKKKKEKKMKKDEEQRLTQGVVTWQPVGSSRNGIFCSCSFPYY